MPDANRRSVVVWSIPLLLLSACNQGHVVSERAYTRDRLPRPDLVLVQDFAVDPSQVRLDQGLGPRLGRMVGAPGPTTQEQVARTAQAALTKALVDKLRSFGLNAEAASAEPDLGAGPVLIVQGQITGIDQGNRTRRTVIGLGAGKSGMTADAELYYRSGQQPVRLLQTLSADSNSGHAPGVAETMGVGAAVGTAATAGAAGAGLHAVGESRNAGPDGNATRIADALAQQMGQFFTSQGWIASPR